MKKRVKWRRLFSVLMVCVCISLMVLSASAASSTDWTANAAQSSLFKKNSSSDFEILGVGSQPVAALSYDPSITAAKTDISTTKISFQITISDAEAGHNDFYALFALRMRDPSMGVWGSSNAGITLQFNAGKVELRRWTNGVFDESSLQSMEVDIIDGKKHDVTVKIEDKTITATVDEQSISASYAVIPAAGGYQVMAYKSKVKIAGFDDGAKPSSAPASSESLQATSSESLQVTSSEIPASSVTVSSQTQGQTSSILTSPVEAGSSNLSALEGEASSGSWVWILVTVVVVLLCVGGGLAYYFLIFKKK